MCGTMTKEGKRLILAVGGHNSPNVLSCCEYIELPNIEWKKCHDLPIPLFGAELIEDAETGDLLLLGGQKGDTTIQDTIYRLSDINGEWILQDETLQVPRNYVSAMVVPDGIFLCDKSNSEHDEL